MMSLFKSDEEKRAFLEIKPGDDPHIRAMKSELLMLMDMSPEEKKLHLAQQRVKDEERHLEWMIDSNRRDDEFIADCIARAKSLVQDYQMFGGSDESWLESAELWTDLAKSTKAAKFTIKDIRKQREKIQWEQRKLKMMQPSVEPSQSSSNSKT